MGKITDANRRKIMDEACDRISSGESLRSVLRDKHMPSMPTILKWLVSNADLADQYARAREAMADADADKIGDIADKVLAGELDPQAARVAIDAYKWSAGKRKPKVYGEKLDLGVSGEITVNITGKDADL